MAKYLFTHDQRDNSFPERYRVVSADDDAEFLRKSEQLSGTVPDTEAIEFLEKLMARCEASESIYVEFVDAPHWRFIELRYRPAEVEAAKKAAENPSGDSGEA